MSRSPQRENKKAAYSDQLQSLQRHSEEQTGHYQQLEGQYQQLEGQYQQLEGQYQQLEGQYQQLEGQHQQLENQYGDLQTHQAQVEEKIARIESLWFVRLYRLANWQSGAVLSSSVVVFTSIAANYLPKARVLATSLKRVAPHANFYLMLVDAYPADADWSNEPFDALITVDDLAISNAKGWCFAHQVVELCTAVKGFATSYLLDQPNVEQVFYFDPDMVVHDRFSDLEGWLSDASILLTPHQTEPETGTEAIMDNEMASLKHGVFNMGFFGVRDTAEGQPFCQVVVAATRAVLPRRHSARSVYRSKMGESCTLLSLRITASSALQLSTSRRGILRPARLRVLWLRASR